MPHIAITMFPGRTDEQKAALAKEVKKCVVNTLNVSPAVVSVSVEDVEKDKWSDNVKQFEDCMFAKPGEDL